MFTQLSTSVYLCFKINRFIIKFVLDNNGNNSYPIWSKTGKRNLILSVVCENRFRGENGKVDFGRNRIVPDGCSDRCGKELYSSMMSVLCNGFMIAVCVYFILFISVNYFICLKWIIIILLWKVMVFKT